MSNHVHIDYDLMKQMLDDGKSYREIQAACHCSAGAISLYKGAQKMSRKYDGMNRRGEKRRDPMITLPSLESLALASAKAVARRFGMPLAELERIGWFDGKVYDPERGYVDIQHTAQGWPQRDIETYSIGALR